MKPDNKLLILYAGADEEVPLQQSFELFAALQKANVLYDTVIVPDAGHWGGRSPYGLMRTLRYLAENLGPPLPDNHARHFTLGDHMRVLLVGEQPESVDFSDPALPPGMTAEKIRAGIDKAIQDMSGRGWQAAFLLISPDDSGIAEVRRLLDSQSFDCVVIGGGIRVPPKSLLLFEKLINTVHTGAPGAAIAFNTSPPDSTNAAARWQLR